MKSKIELVASAYSQLRISGLTVQPTPEDVELALVRLEDLMAEFWGDTLDFNYQFEDIPNPNTQSGVDRVHHRMIASNLAVSLCPDFGKDVPHKLQTIATTSLSSSIAVLARERVREVSAPSRMPVGSGFRRLGNRFRRYFPPRPVPETLASNEVMYKNDVNDFVENFSSWLSTVGGNIDNYDIKTTDGLQLVSSSMSGDRQSVEYRIKALGDSGLSNQVVTITIISTQGRQETRERVFNIERPANATSVQASVPPVPPPLFSATVTAIDFATSLTFKADQDFTVDWGDGNVLSYSANTEATSLALGTITFSSTFPVTLASFKGGAQTIDVTESSTLTDFTGAFSSMPELTTLAIADTSNVTDMNTAFSSNPKLTAIPTMDTSKVITMGGTFGGSIALTTIPALDFSTVISMHQAFDGCSGLVSMPALNTSSMEFCSALFRNCSSLVCLTSIDMSVTQVGFTSQMFDGCTSLVAPDATDQNDISFNRNSWTNPAPCP